MGLSFINSSNNSSSNAGQVIYGVLFEVKTEKSSYNCIKFTFQCNIKMNNQSLQDVWAQPSQ